MTGRRAETHFSLGIRGAPEELAAYKFQRELDAYKELPGGRAANPRILRARQVFSVRGSLQTFSRRFVSVIVIAHIAIAPELYEAYSNIPRQAPETSPILHSRTGDRQNIARSHHPY